MVSYLTSLYTDTEYYLVLILIVVEDGLVLAFPDKLPDGFMLKFHNDLRYQRNRTEWSDKCYCGLVPFYNGAEVLILIVVEDGLVLGIWQVLSIKWIAVLILVVVEDGLVLAITRLY